MTSTNILNQSLTSILELSNRVVHFIDLKKLPGVEKLPLSLKILLENVLRNSADPLAIEALLSPIECKPEEAGDIPFHPARVVMQDMAGAPVIHDLVTLREAVVRHGGDSSQINPRIPAELVVDHSVIVDSFGSKEALTQNVKREFERNEERFRFLRWAQTAFERFRVVPPGRGIIHQLNIEHLTRGVMTQEIEGITLAYPDTCIGTDSHTTMVNGLGVLGWGVGGIEATSALLGQPLSLLVPPVVGVELTGEMPIGTTATDLVLTITQILREHGVVGKFVEFHGSGLVHVPVADRVTIANMSPEFGSTAALFPIDQATLGYYRLTGRDERQIELLEAYARAQGLWADGSVSSACYDESLHLDLSSIVPSIAGPYRPQDRIALDQAQGHFLAELQKITEDPDSSFDTNTSGAVVVDLDGTTNDLRHGAIAIAAITSCTNTSNPHVMMTAAMLARNAVARGLRVPPWVKTSLAPGSQVVTRYLEESGLLPSLEALGFHVVGYGCTTCMGNSGGLPEPISQAAREQGLVLSSVLSGNRNFEGRISSDVRMNYLASPPLVIGYALAGTMDVDLNVDPLGTDRAGQPVFLHELWPSTSEVESQLSAVITRSMYVDTYKKTFTGSAQWEELQIPDSDTYEFGKSTYMLSSPFLDGVEVEPQPVKDLTAARVLVKLGDSVTTDHISPVGAIRADSPAGEYLLAHGVNRRDFNTYGARRGNHEVMIRGTFANVRLRNQLLNGREGGYTQILPGGEEASIFEASSHYRNTGTDLLVLAGREYGSGSARDYAAKGTYLLGVKAVLAESYERIHRSNLVGMGVIPLQFIEGQSALTFDLNGTEEYDICGLSSFSSGLHPEIVQVRAQRTDGSSLSFQAMVRVDTPTEAEYIRHGGILPYVMRATLLA